MNKVSKKSLKSSKRKDNDLSKKIKNLTRQGRLEDELEIFETQPDIAETACMNNEKVTLPKENNSGLNNGDNNDDINDKECYKISKKLSKKSKDIENTVPHKLKLFKQENLDENLITHNIEETSNTNDISTKNNKAKKFSLSDDYIPMEVDNAVSIECEEKNNHSSNCAIILNLPHDVSIEELSNFLSKRAIPVDSLTIDNGKHAVIEIDDIGALDKIRNLIYIRQLKNCEDLKVSALSGNTQRLAAFCQRNQIYNKNIILVKNIGPNTKIDSILALVPEEIEIKKHSTFRVHNKKNKTQILSIDLISDKESKNVIEKLNGSVIDGHKLVAESKLNPVEDSNLETQSLTLLIKGLQESVSYQTIKDLEFPCTRIELVKKSAQRMCFLTFQNEKDVTEAFEKLSTKGVDGKKVFVKFVPVNNEEKDSDDIDKTKLHITNLPYSCTKEAMEKEFSMANSLKFPTNSSGKSKGCCYLSFASIELAAMAKEAFKDKSIDGRKIRCQFAKKSHFIAVEQQPKKIKPQDNVITLFNLPKSVTVEELKQKYKNAKIINIVKQEGVFKGIAELHFANQKQAKDVVDGAEIIMDGRKIRAELKGGKWREGTAKKPRRRKPKSKKTIKDEDGDNE